MRKLRIGDKVKIIAGKEKGKIGKVIGFVKDREYVLVEGVNLVTKFIKKGWLGEGKEGTKVKVEAPIHRSNVMVVCPHCEKPTRISITIEDKTHKYRTCKKCGKYIDKGVSKQEEKQKASESKTKKRKTTRKVKESKI